MKSNHTFSVSGALGVTVISGRASQGTDSINTKGILNDIGGRTKVLLTGDYDGSLELYS
jgi:hypothetical protein